MKATARLRTVALCVVLVATFLFCIFSVRFEHATNDPSIFERCEDTITVGRLMEIALLGNRSSVNACINNLRQLDGAKEQWALEHGKKPGDVVTWKDIAPYLGRGERAARLWCPRGGVYRLGRLGEAPKCSIREHVLQ